MIKVNERIISHYYLAGGNIYALITNQTQQMHRWRFAIHTIK